MKCLKCGKESKYEFCRECKEIKHNACAMVSQNRTKLIKLLMGKRLTPEWFEKFILYTNNILKYWKIYMEYKQEKEYKTLKIISWATMLSSVLLAIRSITSIVIVRI